MRIEDLKALNYYESLETDIKTIVLNAFTEGYSQGLRKSQELTINRVQYFDLGLPSGRCGRITTSSTSKTVARIRAVCCGSECRTTSTPSSSEAVRKARMTAA